MLWIAIGALCAVIVVALLIRAFGAAKSEAAVRQEQIQPPAPAPAAAAPAETKPKPGRPGEEDDVTVIAPLPAAAKKAIRAKTGVFVAPAPASATEASVEVAPLPEEPSVEYSDEWESTNPTMPFPMILVSAAARTDVGRRRPLNEDSYVELPDHGVFVVADGMGGHAAGEVASRLAVDAIATAFQTGDFPGEPHAGHPARGDELVRAVEHANALVYAAASANTEQTGMGTTVVAARFSPNKQRVYIAHVGDSRAYRLRDGLLLQMTTDHTVGTLLGTKGPGSAALVRAVGVADRVDVDLIIDSPQAGDYYLLCSDGLSRMVPHQMLAQLVAEGGAIERVVARLVDKANERGGKDNVTAVLIRVEKPKELEALLGR